MDWNALHNSLRIVGPGKSSPKPTISLLDKFETEAQFRLPPTYREYALVFGAGEFNHQYRIYTPQRGKSKGAKARDLLANHEQMHVQGAWLLAKCTPRDLAERLVFFSSSGGGDMIGWDPQDIAPDQPFEYRIYMIEHGFYDVTKIASSFPDFIENVCLQSADGGKEFLPY